MAAAIGSSSSTHVSQNTLANISKSPVQDLSTNPHGFAALLAATQPEGVVNPMTQSGIEPALSLYLQQLESGASAVKPIENKNGSGEIDLGQSGSGSPDISQSVGQISQGG